MLGLMGYVFFMKWVFSILLGWGNAGGVRKEDRSGMGGCFGWVRGLEVGWSRGLGRG